jgi:peptide/nickel transport system permease protein
MIRFLSGRLLEMVPVVLIMSLIAFLLIHMVPGDPARATLPQTATPQQIEARRELLGLNRPLFEQYFDFVTGAIVLSFGRSTGSQEEVRSILARRAIPSILLVIYSVLVMMVIAVPLGVVAALRRGRLADQLIRLLSTLTMVMPAFWLAILLIILVSVKLGWLPTSGYGDTLPQHIVNLTLPAITMGLALFPVIMRLLRSSMIETMQKEYIEAARARGLSQSRVMFKHVLRNSATSTIAVMGLLLGVLLSATVFVEQVFAIPGLGSLLVSSVQQRDFPLVQALTLLFGIAMVLSSLLSDVILGALDPRVRLS